MFAAGAVHQFYLVFQADHHDRLGYAVDGSLQELIGFLALLDGLQAVGDILSHCHPLGYTAGFVMDGGKLQEEGAVIKFD